MTEASILLINVEYIILAGHPPSLGKRVGRGGEGGREGEREGGREGGREGRAGREGEREGR